MNGTDAANWLAAVGASLAALAALAACVATFNQAGHARRSADIQTFALRYEVYDAIVRVYAAFTQSGKLDAEGTNALTDAERRSEFLFSESARKAIELLRQILIRFSVNSIANRMWPEMSDTTLEQCDRRYKEALSHLVPRLRMAEERSPITVALDALDDLFFGGR